MSAVVEPTWLTLLVVLVLLLQMVLCLVLAFVAGAGIGRADLLEDLYLPDEVNDE